MSRSYKKTPILKYAPRKGKWGKKYANDTVRNCKDVGNFGSYKKHYESWDIHDCISYNPVHESASRACYTERWAGKKCTPEDAEHKWCRRTCWKFKPEAAYNYWAKFYLRK